MKTVFRKLAVSLGVAALAASAYGQQINLATQAKGTLPAGVGIARGASLPATCTLGQAFFRTGVTAGQNWYGCTAANTWTLQTGAAASGLTATAIVTSLNSTTVQTVCPTCTLDSAGNSSQPGTATIGAGSSVAGATAWGQGTTPGAAPASSVGFKAPATVTTPFYMTLPAAPIAGFLYNTGTSDPSALSFVAASGTGSVCLSSGSACASGSTPLNWPFAGCDNGALGVQPLWSIPTSTPAVLSCGENLGIMSVATFAFGADSSLMHSFRVPGTFTTAALKLTGFQDQGGSGNVKYLASVSCLPTGSTINAALTYNTASNTGSVATVASNVTQELSITAIALTGCVSGTLAVLKLTRDTSVSGNYAQAYALAMEAQVSFQ